MAAVYHGGRGVVLRTGRNGDSDGRWSHPENLTATCEHLVMTVQAICTGWTKSDKGAES